MRKKIKITSILFFVSLGFLLAFSGQAEAATYYIGPDGDGDCSENFPCSFATAIDKADVTVISARGGTYLGQTWSISKSDITVENYQEEEPILDGEFQRPGQWMGLISVFNKSNVVIDGISLRQAGPKVSEDGNGGAYGVLLYDSSNCTIRNNTFQDIGDGAIMAQSGGGGHLIENNHISRAGLVKIEHLGLWTPTIALMDTPIASIVRGNVLANCGGEGICPLAGTEGTLIENNTIMNTMGPGIYIVGSRNVTARYNLVYFTDIENAGSYYNNGIEVAVDWYFDNCGPEWNTGHRIYGNLVARTQNNLAIGDVPLLEAPASCRFSDIAFYNNTVVEAYHPTNDPRGIYVQASTIGSGIVFKNNIIWQSSGIIADVPAGITFGSNLWSSAPSLNAQSSSDPTAPDYPTLNIVDNLKKNSDWDAFDAGTLSGQEFALETGSPGIASGEDLCDGCDFAKTLDLRAVDFTTGNFPALLDQDDFGDWEIGAGAYVGASSVAPSAPTGLAVR